MVIMYPHRQYVTDELYTRFYTCPKCAYERVPYGEEPYRRGDRYPEYDAKFCPGCGEEIKWTI